MMKEIARTFEATHSLVQALPEMGDLLRWGAFSLGGGIVEGDSDSADNLKGNTDIFGDVGVAGNGNISMSGNATIHGDLYWRSNGTLRMTGNSSVTGVKYHNRDSELDNGVNEATNSSDHAATFASSTAYAGIQNINLNGNDSLTLVAKHDRPGNSTVLNLQDFKMSGKSTLTLQGTASDLFILNVNRQFSLSGNARIVLSGGVTWDDVLFNVRGKGSDVELDGNSSLQGVLAANNRTVRLSGNSVVRGEVVANKIILSGNAQIIHPPLTSP